MPYAYKTLHDPILAHGFNYTVLYLDCDRKGFPHPIIPFHVNCYGSAVISAGGAVAHLYNDRSRKDCRILRDQIRRSAMRSERRSRRLWQRARIAR